MKRRLIVSGVLAISAIASFAIAACSSSDETQTPAPPPDYSGSCAVLASQCHSYSKESAFAKECHDVGHEGKEAVCGPKKEECVKACPPREGGAEEHDSGVDAGDASSSQDASPDAPFIDAGDVCTPYCDCLTPTCGAQMGYPFATAEQCKTACAALPADQKTCLPKWCEKAKTLSDKTHTCEHAWGKFGTDECETLP